MERKPSIEGEEDCPAETRPKKLIGAAAYKTN